MLATFLARRRLCRGATARGQKLVAPAWLGVLVLFPLLVSCSGGGGGAPDPPAAPPAATVSVSEPSNKIATSGTEQFGVVVQNASNPAVNWEVNNIPQGNGTVGTITTQGLYTAPTNVPALPAVTVSAVLAADATKSGSAGITVMSVPQTPSGVFSWRNDNMLSGVNSAETALTPTTVSGTKFGKLFSCPVDGVVYAQPLYVANLSIPAMGLHNVILVGTENDSIYAFDADASPCEQLWQTNFVANLGGATAGVSTVPSGDVGSNVITPVIGITGTPVIDPSTNTLYVVAKTKENGSYVQRLHALDLFLGGEKFVGPATIQANVAGTGDGNNHSGQVPFDALTENQQAGLALANGKIYVVFGGYGSADPFHGWIFTYSAAALNQAPTVFNTTPNGSRGGAGQNGAPLSADTNGNVFIPTGNGTFDVSITGAPAHNDYGETLVRLSGGTLVVGDFFTPAAQALLNSDGWDLGSSGAPLLPDQGGAVPHIAMVGDGHGVLYLLNRDNLGRFTLGGPDKVVDQLPAGTLAGGIFGTPTYWAGANAVYIAASGDTLKSFPFSSGMLTHSPTSQSSVIFGTPGASPVISANGASSGIVWAVDTSGAGALQPAVLRAFNASNLSGLYDSSHKSGDAAGAAVNFAVPTVINGKVYVGTQTEITVYGLSP